MLSEVFGYDITISKAFDFSAIYQITGNDTQLNYGSQSIPDKPTGKYRT